MRKLPRLPLPRFMGQAGIAIMDINELAILAKRNNFYGCIRKNTNGFRRNTHGTNSSDNDFEFAWRRVSFSGFGRDGAVGIDPAGRNLDGDQFLCADEEVEKNFVTRQRRKL